jgi:hypothetical protein
MQIEQSTSEKRLVHANETCAASSNSELLDIDASNAAFSGTRDFHAH